MPNTEEEETAQGRRSRNKKLSPETARRVVSNESISRSLIYSNRPFPAVACMSHRNTSDATAVLRRWYPARHARRQLEPGRPVLSRRCAPARHARCVVGDGVSSLTTHVRLLSRHVEGRGAERARGGSCFGNRLNDDADQHVRGDRAVGIVREWCRARKHRYDNLVFATAVLPRRCATRGRCVGRDGAGGGRLGLVVRRSSPCVVKPSPCRLVALVVVDLSSSASIERPPCATARMMPFFFRVTRDARA